MNRNPVLSSAKPLFGVEKHRVAVSNVTPQVSGLLTGEYRLTWGRGGNIVLSRHVTGHGLMLAERHVTALMHSARLRSKEGNWIASLEIYRRIIDEEPDYLPAYCELARLYLDRDDLAGARDTLQKVVAREPENTEAHFLLGVIEYIEGNFEASLRSYRVVEKQDGLDSNLAMNIALVCEALGLHTDAIRNLEHAIEHGEANARVYEVLADLYRAVNDTARSIQVLEMAARKFPGEASVQYGLGLAYVKANNLLKAEAAFDTASRLSPDEAAPLDELARLYAKLDRMRDAVAVLAKLTEIDPESVQNWVRLARAYYVLGEREKSEEVLKEARDVHPDDTSIMEEMERLKGSQEEGGAKEASGNPEDD
jgi:tetratricopeptide (TPR) repeat protein